MLKMAEMSVCNRGRKVLIDLYYEFSEKEITDKDQKIVEKLKELDLETRRCLIQYLIREKLEKTMAGKPMVAALYEVVRKEFPVDVLRYVKLLQFEYMLDHGTSKKDEDEE